MTDHRTPPHDFEAEKALLGVAILEPKRIPDLIALVSDADFYGDKNREIFKSIVTLATDGKEVSLASVYENLEGRVSATEIGKLVDGVQAGLDVYAYGRIVKEKAGLRNIIKAAQEIVMSAYDGDEDAAGKLIDGLSMVKLMGRREHALADEVKKWVELTTGAFSVTDCFSSLQNVTSRDKANIRVILSRLREVGFIEPSGSRDGVYRRIERTLDPIDFLNAPTEGLEFDWPLDLNEICTIFPKDIVCFSGTQNAGKTSMAINFIRRNMDKWEIHYFNSEMSASRLRDRLSKVDDVALDAWKFNPYTRSDDFQDVIKPNAVNIIDYLEVVENYWMVAKNLKDIHKKLDQGIAIVMLQKDEFRDVGRGGSMGLEKPVLYVTIDHGKAKIIKVKSWKGDINPNKYIIDFKLVDGWKFVTQGPWHSEEAGDTANKALRQTKFQRTFGR